MGTSPRKLEVPIFMGTLGASGRVADRLNIGAAGFHPIDPPNGLTKFLELLEDGKRFCNVDAIIIGPDTKLGDGFGVMKDAIKAILERRPNIVVFFVRYGSEENHRAQLPFDHERVLDFDLKEEAWIEFQTLVHKKIHTPGWRPRKTRGKGHYAPVPHRPPEIEGGHGDTVDDDFPVLEKESSHPQTREEITTMRDDSDSGRPSRPRDPVPPRRPNSLPLEPIPIPRFLGTSTASTPTTAVPSISEDIADRSGVRVAGHSETQTLTSDPGVTAATRNDRPTWADLVKELAPHVTAIMSATARWLDAREERLTPSTAPKEALSPVLPWEVSGRAPATKTSENLPEKSGDQPQGGQQPEEESPRLEVIRSVGAGKKRYDTVSLAGHTGEVVLTHTERLVLEHLIQNRKRWVTGEKIQAITGKATLAAHFIRKIRRALGQAGWNIEIESSTHSGYMIR